MQAGGDEYKIHRYVLLRIAMADRRAIARISLYALREDTLTTFKNGRCRTCSSQNDGECNFVLGKGPYCPVSPDSKDVEPCKKCCTEPAPAYDSDGYCY